MQKPNKMRIKSVKYLKMFTIALAITAIYMSVCYYWISSTGQALSFDDIEAIEVREVALVLGTSRSVNGVYENPFFTHRMEAAAALYHAGKVKHILVSGDNSTHNYNEPRDMRQKLIALGVPKEAITMDFAGLRTLDSVVRSKEIFQQRKIIIVSQEFHNHRALFIARYHGINAIAYNAKYPIYASNKTLLREVFARSCAVLDLYLLGTQPKYLGDKIDIRV